MIDFNKFGSRLEEYCTVPPELIEYTVGHTDLMRYHATGLDIAKLFASVLYKYTGMTFQSMKNILDFGSGAGRIIEKFPKLATQEYYGCDISKELVPTARETFKK